MKNMENNGGNTSHSSKNTSSCRVKYNFTMTVEEMKDGILQPTTRINMNADVEVNEIRQAVRQIVKGAVEGVSDGLFPEKDSEDHNEDPIP